MLFKVGNLSFCCDWGGGDFNGEESQNSVPKLFDFVSVALEISRDTGALAVKGRTTVSAHFNPS